MRASLPALALLAAGCATMSPEAESPSTQCRSEGPQALIGREASVELGTEALRLSGARRLRWIRPGDAVTMDYSTERLNLHLDSANRVERASCG